MYAHPEAFHDITIGANNGCGLDIAFECAPGWDPVTGTLLLFALHISQIIKESVTFMADVEMYRTRHTEIREAKGDFFELAVKLEMLGLHKSQCDDQLRGKV